MPQKHSVLSHYGIVDDFKITEEWLWIEGDLAERYGLLRVESIAELRLMTVS